MEHRGVTLKRAGEIIGGDEPLSVRTISAYITRGDLEAYGKRSGRRVTMRSINAYLEGGRGQWRNDPSPNAGSPIPAIPLKSKTARGTRSFQNREAATTSERVSIPSRLPKRGLIRS